MDLDLLDATLAELGEASYRAGQVWRWMAAGARFTALFHDTHHRAVSEPDAITAFEGGGPGWLPAVTPSAPASA